jgi:hypothetical protein
MSSLPVQRPGTVTVVVVLAWIAAILSIIGAILLMIAAIAVDAADRPADLGVLWAAAIVWLIVGLVTAWVARALGRGSRVARAVLTAVQLVTIITAIWTWFQIGGNYAASAIGNILVAVVILALVWNRRANDFFAAS